MQRSSILAGLGVLAVQLIVSPRKRLLSSADDLAFHHSIAEDNDHSGHTHANSATTFRHVHEAPLLSPLGGIGVVLLGYCAAQLYAAVRAHRGASKVKARAAESLDKTDSRYATAYASVKSEEEDGGWAREAIRLLRLGLLVVAVKSVGPVRAGVLMMSSAKGDYALLASAVLVLLSQVQAELSLVLCLALAALSAAEPFVPRLGSRLPALALGLLTGLGLVTMSFKASPLLLPPLLLSAFLPSLTRTSLLTSAASAALLSPSGLRPLDLLTLTPSLLPLTSFPRTSSFLRQIWLNPASKRIFLFLLLNLGYMFVQLAYGIYTNSLGLISDAIHMLFDCLGLGIGLWASIAATWPPDARYTFGYNRVEALSGFGNGVFLCLVSVFIMVEGIQRVFDPPEMETRQLLLVSSVGLGINLFGMWATGGHHHHGHSHGHEVHVHEKKTDAVNGHGHGHGQGECNGHDHHNGHAHSHSHGHDHAHTNGHSHGNGHAHSHSHDDGHSHNHSHHDHSHANGHANGHAHSHSHHDHSHHDHSHSHSHHSHSHDHDHDHGHDHDHAHSHNMHGVFLHVLADTLGSVGVIVSTLLIRWTGLTIWDPLASLFIAILILASVAPLVLESGRVLALELPEHRAASVRKALTELNAEGVHFSAPRFWNDVNGMRGSIHLQLQGSRLGVDRVKGKVRSALKPLRLKELVVQAEGDGFCDCMTGST